MAEQVRLEVVKAERRERDRLWSREELLRFVNELPEDIGAFAILAMRRNNDGSVRCWTKITGSEVQDMFCAQYMAAVKLPQINLSEQ